MGYIGVITQLLTIYYLPGTSKYPHWEITGLEDPSQDAGYQDHNQDDIDHDFLSFLLGKSCCPGESKPFPRVV